MPTVYEDPTKYGLVLVGELQELRVYEDVFCHNWHIAVWQDAFGNLRYAVESRFGERFTAPPFEHINSLSGLHPLVTQVDFEDFKIALNDYWVSQSIPLQHLTEQQRWMRNKRKRLQHKVWRIVFTR